MRRRGKYLPAVIAVVLLAASCGMNPQDESIPSVVSVYPADGATAVPQDTGIVITFSEPMDTASCEARFLAYRDDVGQMGHMMMHDQPEMPGHFTWNEDHTVMTFHPDPAFGDSTMYTYHLLEGMESHHHGGQMMMSGMTAFGRSAGDGIICTFTTGLSANHNNDGNNNRGM